MNHRHLHADCRHIYHLEHRYSPSGDSRDGRGAPTPESLGGNERPQSLRSKQRVDPVTYGVISDTVDILHSDRSSCTARAVLRAVQVRNLVVIVEYHRVFKAEDRTRSLGSCTLTVQFPIVNAAIH